LAEATAESAPPIQYMERTRDYYLALGYANPYRWAQFDDVPFARLRKELSESRIALITTAAPFQPEAGDQGPGAEYNARAKFFDVMSFEVSPRHDFRISHVGYDRDHTSAEDPNTWFPLRRLEKAAEAGRIESVAPRVHCLPTSRSQRATRESFAPVLLERCLEDQADLALLVPN
jgi:hypothetical protein